MSTWLSCFKQQFAISGKSGWQYNGRLDNRKRSAARVDARGPPVLTAPDALAELAVDASAGAIEDGATQTRDPLAELAAGPGLELYVIVPLRVEMHWHSLLRGQGWTIQDSSTQTRDALAELAVDASAGAIQDGRTQGGDALAELPTGPLSV
ncbi:hypothetical protein NDU88_010347 [Pleurodeles waltl]|uniref:Uncharacterized protein n=1 Tax=Pleurodeles waltl TaxID=8319 RepID=A0AAV7PY22_PLEWA|nr:hypothetical protein NDU88_010347 [Pleurodeles waltl]